LTFLDVLVHNNKLWDLQLWIMTVLGTRTGFRGCNTVDVTLDDLDSMMDLSVIDDNGLPKSLAITALV
jgi:hypothetical protein